MAARRRNTTRRSTQQVAVDARTAYLAAALGRAVRAARRQAGRTQAHVGNLAGVAQSTVSDAELGRTASLSLATWGRLAAAVGSDLHAYLSQASTTDLPRDHAHLRAQELVLRTAAGGGWTGRPEEMLDVNTTGSRAADVVLRRGGEVALVEVWDWFEDVGAAIRSWDRRLARLEQTATASHPMDTGRPVARACGCWVVRATRRNRLLVGEHRAFFRARFGIAGASWLAALRSRATIMPDAPAMLWISVNGDHVFASRLAGHLGAGRM